MANPAFRSIGTLTTYTTHVNPALAAPAGIADGDLLVIAFFIGQASSTPPTPTFPVGFSHISGSPVSMDAGGFFGKFSVLTKIAASESGTYGVTHISLSSTGVVYCASSPGSITSTVQNHSGTGDIVTAATATGLTAVANSLVVMIGQGWGTSLFPLSPPTGTTPTFTERLDITNSSGLIYIADGSFAAGGATGTKTVANINNPQGPATGILLSIAPPIVAVDLSAPLLSEPTQQASVIS